MSARRRVPLRTPPELKNGERRACGAAHPPFLPGRGPTGCHRVTEGAAAKLTRQTEPSLRLRHGYAPARTAPRSSGASASQPLAVARPRGRTA